MKLVAYYYQDEDIRFKYDWNIIHGGQMVAFTNIYPDDDDDIFQVRLEDAIDEGYLPDGNYSFYIETMTRSELDSLRKGGAILI